MELPPPPLLLSPAEIKQAQRRTKAIDSMKLANASLDYSFSTEQIAEGYSTSYGLNAVEKYHLRRELCKMRLGQKALMLKMRAQSEERRQAYLSWFEKESLKIMARHSDSDDDNFDLGRNAP